MTSDRSDVSAMRDRFYAQTAEALRRVIQRVVASAPAGGIYVAAGVVRDLLLGRQPLDIDLVTEADAIEVARRAVPGATTVTHERFRTATLEIDGHRIDLATARRERYAHPGALPDIEPARIEDDLRRRDFSMNALALRLDGDAVLLDPTGGIADIEARLVRVLHDRSFEDDATRIFRAFRYALRLGFTLESRTRALLEGGISYIHTVSGERLRHELHLLFAEPSGAGALEQLDAVGALRAIHATLAWSKRDSAALAAAGDGSAETGFALLASDVAAEDVEAIAGRLQLSREESDAVRGMCALRSAATALQRADVKPSGVVAVLDRIPDVAVGAFAALTDDQRLRGLLQRYLKEWRHEKPMLSGHDLREMGIPEGPEIGRGLRLIRAARLDGWANDRDDERALALRFAKSIRDSRAMNQPLDFKLYEN